MDGETTLAGHSVPRWAPLAGGALVLGYLLLRAKGASSGIAPAAESGTRRRLPPGRTRSPT